MSADVVEVHHSLARCPKCHSTEWEIVLDGFRLDWSNILGFVCTTCSFSVDIKIIELADPLLAKQEEQA